MLCLALCALCKVTESCRSLRQLGLYLHCQNPALLSCGITPLRWRAGTVVLSWGKPQGCERSADLFPWRPATPCVHEDFTAEQQTHTEFAQGTGEGGSCQHAACRKGQPVCFTLTRRDQDGLFQTCTASCAVRRQTDVQGWQRGQLWPATASYPQPLGPFSLGSDSTFLCQTYTTCFPSLLLLPSFEAVVPSPASWKHKRGIGKNATSAGDGGPEIGENKAGFLQVPEWDGGRKGSLNAGRREERLPTQALKKTNPPIAPCSCMDPTLLPLQNTVPPALGQLCLHCTDSKHKPRKHLFWQWKHT